MKDLFQMSKEELIEYRKIELEKHLRYIEFMKQVTTGVKANLDDYDYNKQPLNKYHGD